MMLIEKLNKELSKEGLEFKLIKEFNEKFSGLLIDKKSSLQTSFELWKCLQGDQIKSHAKWCRSYMDMFIKLNNLDKGGE